MESVWRVSAWFAVSSSMRSGDVPVVPVTMKTRVARVPEPEKSPAARDGQPDPAVLHVGVEEGTGDQVPPLDTGDLEDRGIVGDDDIHVPHRFVDTGKTEGDADGDIDTDGDTDALGLTEGDADRLGLIEALAISKDFPMPKDLHWLTEKLKDSLRPMEIQKLTEISKGKHLNSEKVRLTEKRMEKLTN
jgi:hypothetical protein